ncbi:hypothetical protein GCM10027428_10230 [Haliea atlantica]
MGHPEAVASLQDLISSSTADIDFVGPVFSDSKADLLIKSHGLILPSQTEGLPMTLLEAASYGIPLFITQECNLDWVEAQGAGRSVPHSDECVVSLIDAFANTSLPELQKMGLICAEEARLRYSKEVVSSQWLQIYNLV